MEKAKIKKDIFVAVITSGSLKQKENWKATCEAAAEWVLAEDTLKKTPKRNTSK